MDFLAARSDVKNAADRLADSGLLSCVHVLIAPKDPNDGAAPFYSASAALIDFGGRPCLVTNKHVLDVYFAELDRRPTVFEFAGIGIDPLPRLYSEDADVDLVVLRLDGLRIRADRDLQSGVPNIQFYNLTRWPPAPARAGDRVFFAGWPEVGRSVDRAVAEVMFQPYSWYGTEIHNVAGDQFSILFERERFRGTTGWETAEQLAERNLSGLSGTPIFREASPPEIIGFVKQYSAALDYLVATSALNLRADGQIERYIP